MSILIHAVVMDIIYVLDASRNVGKTNFKNIIDFIKDSSKKYRVSFEEAHVGVITFNDDARIQFGLFCCHSKKELDQALDDLFKQLNVGSPGKDAPASMMGRGLSLALTLFQGPSARATVEHVLVVLTATTAADDVYTPSKRLKSAGVNVFGIGIGNDFGKLDLIHVASEPMFRHLFKLEDYSQLKQRYELFVDRAIRGECVVNGYQEIQTQTTTRNSNTNNYNSQPTNHNCKYPKIKNNYKQL